MKLLTLEPNMLTLRGVFYPTGHMFIMFPTEKDARDAAYALEEENGHSGESISLLTPAGHPGEDRAHRGQRRHSPALGRNGSRHRAPFRRTGQPGSLRPDDPCALCRKHTEHIMKVLKEFPISYAQKYRHLVIEDLVE